MGEISKHDKSYLIRLGKHISELRKAKGITQVELGLRCDIEKPNMNRIEKGGTNPTILTLKKIAKELDINLSELLKGLQE